MEAWADPGTFMQGEGEGLCCSILLSSSGEPPLKKFLSKELEGKLQVKCFFFWGGGWGGE